MWNVIIAVIDNILADWTTIFEEGITLNTYYRDLYGILRGTYDFVGTARATPRPAQGAPP